MSGDHVRPRYTEMADNPLPPGTYDDDPGGDDDRPPSPQRPSSHRKTATATYDPFIKNPEYERYHQRRTSRSRSPESSHRRSSRHNREKGERRRHSRSRSSSYERYHARRKRDHKHDNRTSSRRRRSPSSSRSRSPSRERKSKRSPSYERKVRPHHARSSRRNRSKSRDSDHKQHYSRKEIAAVEEAPADDEEDQEQPKENAFKNDGSFMAMFKKMQEEKERQTQATSTTTSAESSVGEYAPPPRTFAGIGKRRGGRILKTGIVAKPKVEEEGTSDDPQDAWSIYLKEVKRYKEACCDDDSKTRPLVK